MIRRSAPSGLCVLALLAATAGCFSERSFPAEPGDIRRLNDGTARPSDPSNARQWLRAAHAKLKDLLPADGREKCLLTEDLTTREGKPVDVLSYFGWKGQALDSIFTNCAGLQHSAQTTGGDHPDARGPPAWPGFEDVWVPIKDDLRLAGRLGIHRRGGVIQDSDCIVILPGLLGHNQIMRTRDLARALLDEGFHVLAVELRGHGQTEVRYPQVNYAFGVLEAGDLLAVSEWLTATPHVQRTGLVGFCWGANEGLLTAWEDNRSENHPSISDRLRPLLRPSTNQRHYEAGVMVFSPVLRIDEILISLSTPQSPLVHPVLASLQSTVLARMMHKGHPDPDGSLRHLLSCELEGAKGAYGISVDDAVRFVRMLPFRGQPDGDKLARVRIPTLIVHGANDPLSCAQDVAELMSRTPNPNVAAIILPGGGHVGFGPYASEYYYSLIVNFFDAGRGPRSTVSGAIAGP